MASAPATRIRSALAGAVLLACAGAPRPGGTAPGTAILEEQSSGVSAVLQAVSAVSDDVAWVSGHDAAVLRTTDGGTTWERLHVPDADSLEFRDVEAFGADVAYLLAAGPGARSRIYRTGDGGRTWTHRRVLCPRSAAAEFQLQSQMEDWGRRLLSAT